MNLDPLLRHAEPDHHLLERFADREQPAGGPACCHDLLADAGPPAPILDVGPARLDREGHAQIARQQHRRRSIRPEEFGVDHVEREALAYPAEHGQQCRRHRPGRSRLAYPRQHPETGPMHCEPLPVLPARQACTRSVMRVARQRPWRQADR
jgi:hypothetical protein